MNLRKLAELASDLPKITFDWAGPEQYCDNVIKDIIEREGIENYIKLLASRMGEYSKALNRITELYSKLRELILDARIEDENKPSLME